MESEEKKAARGLHAGRKNEGNRSLSRRIALLMESWLSVGPGYNLHYIYLPGFVVLPKCRPEGPPPSKHKAVKRFNSIRATQRRGVASTNLTPPIVSRFEIRSRRPTTLPQRFNTLPTPSVGDPFRYLAQCFKFFLLVTVVHLHREIGCPRTRALIYTPRFARGEIRLKFHGKELIVSLKRFILDLLKTWYK